MPGSGSRSRLLVLLLVAGPGLGVALLLAQTAPTRDFPDSPYLRIDPAKIQTAEVCGECHAQEYEAWSGSRHQTQFADLHQSEKAQGILDNMGFRLAKRESLCLRCHYTATIRREQARAVSGVSCESCHGAALDWVDAHNDYGGATHDTESAQHREIRVVQSVEGGMLRPSGDMYSVAANCFECHTVPDERLINEGGHPSGSDFELVAWSDSIRHNYLQAQWSSDQSNRAQSQERKRLMYVVGAILDYEYSLRGLAKASERTPYSKAMERRSKVAFRALRSIAGGASASALDEILTLGGSLTLGPGREAELVEAADQISALAHRFERSFDAGAFAALDRAIAGEPLASSEPIAEAVAPTTDAVATTDPNPGTSTVETAETAPGATSAQISATGQIRTRPAWLPDEQYQTTVPGCSCHTQAEDWLLDDAHSGSLDLMSSPRATQIAQIYGLSGSSLLRGSQMCMNCHGTVLSGEEREEVFDPVSCESCHGPSSGYLDPHERGSGEGYALGMRRLKQADTQAATCAGCHHITDERLLSAGHSSGADYDFLAANQAIAHWPDRENVTRDGPYPHLSPGDLSSAMTRQRASRPVPVVQVVDVEPAPVAPRARATPRSARTTSGRFLSPSGLRRASTGSGAPVRLPPLPEVTDSTSTDEILLIVKRRLDAIYAALGRAN